MTGLLISLLIGLASLLWVIHELRVTPSVAPKVGMCEDCLHERELTAFMGSRVCPACVAVRRRDLDSWHNDIRRGA